MNNRLKDIIVVIIIPSFLVIMMFINIIKKDCEVSITERRKLEQFPGLALSNIVDGIFMKKFDKYSTDQFYNRDGFRLLKANIDLSGYTVGEHDVDVQVTGSDNKLTYESKTKKVKIRILEK